MPGLRTENQALRRALAHARLRDVDVAAALGVDPKTVRRWLDGRTPHVRHRWALSDLVGRHEFDLWPQVVGVEPVSQEIVATYPHRSSVPGAVWRSLFSEARDEIGILVYSGLFLAEDAECLRLLTARGGDGVRVRILLGDPDAPHVHSRGAEEGIDAAMAAKVRNALVLYQPILQAPGVEIRVHTTVLYSSIYRADDQLLINPHVYGLAAAQAPMWHLRRQGDGGLASTYLAAFERVWGTGRSVSAD